MRILKLPGLPAKGDASDWITAGGTAEQLWKLAEQAPEWRQGNATHDRTDAWPDPVPLPHSLLPVAPFDYDMLPEKVRPWVKDVCERMQCPPDYVGGQRDGSARQRHRAQGDGSAAARGRLVRRRRTNGRYASGAPAS